MKSMTSHQTKIYASVKCILFKRTKIDTNKKAILKIIPESGNKCMFMNALNCV